MGLSVTAWLAIAGAVMSAASATYTAVAQKRTAQYNKRVNEVNAKAAKDYANSIEAQGEWRRRKLATESLLEFGKAKTGYAASGVALGAGTPNDYEADIADAYELDSRQLDFDIQSQKYQALMQGANYSNQAKLYSMEAGNIQSMMPLTIASSALQGAAAGASLGKSMGGGKTK